MVNCFAQKSKGQWQMSKMFWVLKMWYFDLYEFCRVLSIQNTENTLIERITHIHDEKDSSLDKIFLRDWKSFEPTSSKFQHFQQYIWEGNNDVDVLVATS